MKLWLISQNVNSDYDTYDSAVVAADSTEAARQIHPMSERSPWTADRWAVARWAPPEEIEVVLIGTAEPDTKPGVILASFNAG